MRRIIFMVLVVALVGSVTAYADKAQDKEAIFKELSAYVEGEPAVLANVVFALGDAYARANKIDNAIALYEKAQSLLSDNEDFLNRLAGLYNQKMNYEKAVTVYEKLTALKPDNSWYLQMLSNSLNMAGKKDKAQALWKDLVAKKGDDVNVLGAAANFYNGQNDLENAVILTERLAKLQPDSTAQMQNLASLYARAEKFDKAEALYKKVLETAKDQWLKDWANNELLNMYQKQNKLDEVAISYEAELQKNPKDINQYKRLGELYVRKGDNEKALGVFSKAADAFPDDRNLNNRLVDLCESAGKYQDAAARLAKIIQQAPNEPYLLERLANLYERADKKDEAKGAWQSLIAKMPNDAWLYSRYAEALYKLKDVDAALSQLKKAQSIDPNNMSFTLRSSDMLIANGKVEEAKVILGRLATEAKEDWVKNEAKRRLADITAPKTVPAQPAVAAPKPAEIPKAEPVSAQKTVVGTTQPAKPAAPATTGTAKPAKEALKKEEPKKKGLFGR